MYLALALKVSSQRKGMCLAHALEGSKVSRVKFLVLHTGFTFGCILTE